jgi:endonuclease/exonuclease/phosphatase family metal-dependent hydrolase
LLASGQRHRIRADVMAYRSHAALGSAVVSYGPALTEVATARSPFSRLDVPLRGTHPGSVAVAQATLPDHSTLTLISVYGLIDAGYSVTTMHRILSDLTSLFDDRRYSQHLLLGGDLNISTQMPAGHRRRHQLVLERIQVFGLVDCLDRTLGDTRPLAECPCGAATCRHIRTHRHGRRPQAPWQTDYLFASERRAAKLTACCAHDQEAAWALSDHCPVIADFAWKSTWLAMSASMRMPTAMQRRTALCAAHAMRPSPASSPLYLACVAVRRGAARPASRGARPARPGISARAGLVGGGRLPKPHVLRSRRAIRLVSIFIRAAVIAICRSFLFKRRDVLLQLSSRTDLR